MKTQVSAQAKTQVSVQTKTKFQCRLMREARYAGIQKLFSALALAAAVAPVWAATQTVKLSVPGMTCAACPITVKKAIFKVKGVSKVDVTFEKREAIVTFDDAKTDVQKLTQATADAGYPSSVRN